MDAESFRGRVTDAKSTELDRLGSEKLLIALTDADLSQEAILEAAAASEHSARNTFEQWTESEDDERAREVFANVAAQEADHCLRVAERLSQDFEPPDGGPLHAHLRQQEDSIARAAGLVGRGLVSDRTHLQVISFFVNEGDTAKADLFRDLREDTEGSLQSGLDLLESLCEDDEDWEAAEGVASYAIQIAYDDYADALAGLGMDPRPIC